MISDTPPAGAKCCRTVFERGVNFPRGYTCTKPATVVHDGKNYCTLHSPTRLKAVYAAKEAAAATAHREEARRFASIQACADMANPVAEVERLCAAALVLSQIVDALPGRRDWLDPDLEKAAKAILIRDTKPNTPA